MPVPVPLFPPTRAEIVHAALSLVGTPYHHQGREAGVALDCAGVPIVTGRLCGYEFDETPDYQPTPDGHTLLRTCREQLAEKPARDAKPGDVLLFYIRHRGIPHHLGILIPPAEDDPANEQRIVHAFDNARVQRVHVSGIEGFWRDRIMGAFEFPGVI